jgi:hypothetical protein
MNTQPEALLLAGYLDDCNRLDLTIPEAAAELRRLHEANQSLITSFKMCLDTAYVEHAHDIAISALAKAKEQT